VDAGTWALIQGAYRKTWYHNQLLLAAARELAALLGNAGIPVMLLKGAPLALTNYRDVGARPMGDLDLAVPVAFARKAVERMLAHGWTPEATPLTATMTPGRRHDAGWIPGLRTLAGFDERYFNVRHAHGFRRANGLGIDLHWHVFQGDCDPESDDDTWRHAGVVTHGGCSFQIPTQEEHLLLILAHAARWSPTSSIRWVADAGTLLQANPSFDWARFLIVAAQRRQTGRRGTAHLPRPPLPDRGTRGGPPSVGRASGDPADPLPLPTQPRPAHAAHGNRRAILPLCPLPRPAPPLTRGLSPGISGVRLRDPRRGTARASA
jgi:hypothetical protein